MPKLVGPPALVAVARRAGHGAAATAGRSKELVDVIRTDDVDLAPAHLGRNALGVPVGMKPDGDDDAIRPRGDLDPQAPWPFGLLDRAGDAGTVEPSPPSGRESAPGWRVPWPRSQHQPLAPASPLASSFEAIAAPNATMRLLAGGRSALPRRGSRDLPGTGYAEGADGDRKAGGQNLACRHATARRCQIYPGITPRGRVRRVASGRNHWMEGMRMMLSSFGYGAVRPESTDIRGEG